VLGEQCPERLDVLAPPPRSGLADAVGHLVHGDPVDRQASRRGLHREGAAGRGSVQVGHAAGLGDERLDVLDLAFHRVRQRVAAVAAASAVVVVRGEMRRQFCGERGVLRAVDGTPADQDDGRSAAFAVVCD
jgi:hypothetical protein